jgi:hypothetical protein
MATTPRVISDLTGTALTKLGVAIGAARIYLKAISGGFAVRDATDAADAEITASKVHISGEILEINSDAAGSGADWKYILQRPTSGMTAAVTLTVPVDDGTPNQVLQTDGSGVLSWVTPSAGVSDMDRRDTTNLAFGTSSPVAMFTTPASSEIYMVRVLVDTAFTGTAPTLSIGVSGTTSKYGSTGQIDLKTIGIYEWNPGVAIVGGEALIATYAADSSGAGAARIEVEYGVPS